MNRLHFIGPFPFFQRAREGAVPSLPAGINEDESDPAWGRIEAWNLAPLSGPHDPPLFWGVALVLPDLPGSARARPMSRGQPARNNTDRGKRLWNIYSVILGTPPPSESVPFNMWSFVPFKTPRVDLFFIRFHPVSSGAEKRVARHVE